MGARLVTALAAAIGAAFVATLAAHAAPPETEGERSGASPAVRAPPAGDAPGAVTAVPATVPAGATTRPRVPPGVLVRAASRRAQEREAASPAPVERRRAHDQGNIISVEIDWHAGTADR